MPRSIVLTIIGDVLGNRPARSLSWPRSFAYLLLVAAASGYWYRADLARSVPLAADGHALMSLSVAVNRAFCKHPSRLSNGAQISQMLLETPSDIDKPIAQILTDKWGSIEAYCATITTPYLNNENSLMLAESWILRLAPASSLASLGRAMLAVKALMVLLLGLALLRGGSGVIVTALVVEIGFAILHGLQPIFAYSVYTFFVPLTLLPMAIYLLSAEARLPVRLAVALIGGVLSAYGANMRTSYVPLYVAMLMLFVIAADWVPSKSMRPLKQRLAVSAASIALFAAGYGLFHYTLIVRMREPGVTHFSYHVIWHSVAMSLAAPPNPLAEREGIRWNDGTGWELARRIKPDVPYLGPGYEEALQTYYFSLWKKYPAEMRQIYWEKFKLGGRHMIENAALDSLWVKWMLRVLAIARNGLFLLAGFIAIAALSSWRYFRSRHALPLTLLYISGVGLLLLIEASAIMPYFYLSYQSNLLFASVAVVTLLLGHAVFAIPARLLERPESRTAAAE